MPSPPLRIGVVGFLNALPLIDGLERLRALELHSTVPSRLVGALLDGAVDVALCSSIDYQRSAVPTVILPAGMLGGIGPTLTVRLYATEPIDRVTRVHCDTDSHTSVALLRILLRERYGAEPALVAYDARRRTAGDERIEWPEAVLVIGDKVVGEAVRAVRYPHQLDLGAEWTAHTGKPFVFALWLAREDADPRRVRLAAAILDRQRRANLARLDTIVHRHAEAHGWPRDLATTYVRESLRYDLDDAAIEGLELFYDKALAHGLIPTRRPLAGVTEPAAIAGAGW